MRRPLALTLVVVMSAVGLGVAVPVVAHAGCVGPQIRKVGGTSLAGSHPQVTVNAGSALVVVGAEFFDSCDDVVVTTSCSTSGGTGAADPSRGVSLVLTQGSRLWLLGKANAEGADKDFAIRWDVRLPPDVRPGPATLSAGTAKVSVVVS